MLTRTATPRARRTGFTLVELLIAMVLMGIIGGAIVMLLLRQQRFYSSTNELINTRQQIRQAAAMLPADLRGISSIGGDIYLMTDSSIDFRSVFGSAIACSVDGKGSWVSTVPVALAKNSAMTNWAFLPAKGDSVAVYADGLSPTAAGDDSWTITSLSANPVVRGDGDNDGCKVTTGLVQNVSPDTVNSNASYMFAINPSVPTVSPGASLRFFRRVHYSLYKNTVDNLWYLGFSSCRAGSVPQCTTPIQPIGGPYQPFATNGTSGLQFSYYDSTGALTLNKLQVARISLVVRGVGTVPVNLGGTKAGTTFRDSLRMEINLRNRK